MIYLLLDYTSTMDLQVDSSEVNGINPIRSCILGL